MNFIYAIHSALTDIYQKYLCIIEDIILQIQGTVFLKITDLFIFTFNIFIVVLSKLMKMFTFG